ncbi:hypothetical protein ACVIHI_003460 [Bradyrhizobium sp. USDA 4524]|uniref:hypothetical protein n=1 Tax=unclassified Bradyrhizobium TaxID=2631580 RepID=UPI0020A1A72B|nr:MULTISPECIES: hypothetical protein [unclassified Bradyrhizobium]MCP1843622.1 hypothetical protein [Bradyrhizobium sp. USDA 4538]MCP1904188.1 hypothetical protein [Bradyrhizobium sp. USDA 4537]MCP1990156.1 hypothetical protein [Bradyrhizobium sp. USDA 4539]
MNNVPTLDAPKSSDRDAQGRWLTTPGRPRGSRNRLSSEMLASIKDMGKDAIVKLRDALNDKDSPSHWKALELILRYCLPPARTVELDDAEPETIKQAFIDGTLSADETKAIAIAMEKLKSVADIGDIQRQLEELTALVATQKQSK